MKRAIIFLLTIALGSFSAINAFDFNANYVLFGTGSWVHIPSNNGKPIYFNKTTASTYFSIAGLSGFVAVPFAWTASPDKANNNYKIGAALGDLNFYFGKQFGLIESRIGLVLPLGYNNTKQGVWIGSSNIILKIGAGFNPDIYESSQFNVGGDLYFNLYITDDKFITSAYYDIGTWSISYDAKFSFRPIEKLKIGSEVLGGIKREIVNYDNSEHWGISIVPHHYVSYDISGNFHINGKIGYGPSFSKKIENDSNWQRSNSLNVGISLGWYP